VGAVSTRYLTIEEAAPLVGMGVRRLRERAAEGTVTHRRIGGTRRLLFDPDELERWANGAELETIRTPGGGRIVRPK
jgi:excisionase family DNA binding protein